MAPPVAGLYPSAAYQLSPDGNYLLVLPYRDNRLYLAAISHSSVEAPVISPPAPTAPLRRLTRVGADYFAWADWGQNHHLVGRFDVLPPAARGRVVR